MHKFMSRENIGVGKKPRPFQFEYTNWHKLNKYIGQQKWPSDETISTGRVLKYVFT